MFKDMKVRRSTLFVILYSTWSQWRLQRVGNTWSNLEKVKMSYAALF